MMFDWRIFSCIVDGWYDIFLCDGLQKFCMYGDYRISSSVESCRKFFHIDDAQFLPLWISSSVKDCRIFSCVEDIRICYGMVDFRIPSYIDYCRIQDLFLCYWLQDDFYGGLQNISLLNQVLIFYLYVGSYINVSLRIMLSPLVSRIWRNYRFSNHILHWSTTYCLVNYEIYHN